MEGDTMTEKINSNNQAVLAGEIISEFEYSHDVFGERFYQTKMKVNRLSHVYDTIPLLVSDRLMDVTTSFVGEFVEVRGQFRSYNKHENNRNHLVLSLFVREFILLGDLSSRIPNAIFLDGYICKEPVYRITPLGREITDILLAVNRAYSKSDYIPCICWGRNARYAGNLAVGSRIQIWGRMQSRQYQKRTGDGREENRTAYEISASKIEYIVDYNINQAVADSAISQKPLKSG